MWGKGFDVHYQAVFVPYFMVKGMRTLFISCVVLAVMLAVEALCVRGYRCEPQANVAPLDTMWRYPDVLPYPIAANSIYDSLAAELNVEVAAFKAVSSIESGSRHTAFISPGSPVVNLEVPMFVDMLESAGYDVDSLRVAVPDAFSRPDTDRYGDLLAAQRAMYRAASSIDDSIAKLSTYWGMYQIRGSNWALCGVGSVDEFVEMMSESEDMQHRLFATYLKNTGLDRYLRSKDWERFARAYNGAGYARNGYHVKLENAYAKYKSKNNK